MNAIHVNNSDNVGTALTTLNKGDKALGVVIKENVSKGHKFATEDILKGQPIIKYGAHIGVANRNIKSGEWVHIHNIDGERGRGDLDSKTKEISQNGIRDHVILNNKKNYTLSGFRRPDGSFGLRNHVLIIPSVHCANKVVERIANEIKYGSVAMKPDSKVVFFNHQHGCSELSYDASQTQDVLVGSGTNPNVYSVLVVGLGCEVVQAKSIAEQIKKYTPYKKVEYFNIQECGGVNESVKKGVTIVKKMLDEAGHGEAKIFVSNDLDEDILLALAHQGAKIDVYGIGTKLITSYSNASLGGVYKLCAIEEKGKMVPKIKISDSLEKTTNPGIKKVIRIYVDGKAQADMICLKDEVIDTSKPLTITHNEERWKKKQFDKFTIRELSVQIFKDGVLVYKQPTLQEIAEYADNSYAEFDEEYKRVLNTHDYKVDLSQKAWELKEKMISANCNIF